MKNPKLWSWLALLASILCLIAAIYPLMAVRMETMGFRDATGILRTIIQVGLLGVLPFTIIVLFFARKNRAAFARSATATLLVLIPLITAVGAVPAGTTLFATAPAGPPPSTPAAGMGGSADAMGGGAPARTPPLNDISTDTLDPPLYSAVIPLRPEDSNTLEYPSNGPSLQKQLFPDIAPIHSELNPTAALNRAAEVANKMGWKIVSQNTENNTIEAVDATFFFGFKDDVIIRVREHESNTSIIDIRSHSRIGRGDQGKNAARVRQFIAEY
jgi:uncharacterized protein (DUF1499 family)